MGLFEVAKMCGCGLHTQAVEVSGVARPERRLSEPIDYLAPESSAKEVGRGLVSRLCPAGHEHLEAKTSLAGEGEEAGREKTGNRAWQCVDETLGQGMQNAAAAHVDMAAALRRGELLVLDAEESRSRAAACDDPPSMASAPASSKSPSRRSVTAAPPSRFWASSTTTFTLRVAESRPQSRSQNAADRPPRPPPTTTMRRFTRCRVGYCG